MCRRVYGTCDQGQKWQKFYLVEQGEKQHLAVKAVEVEGGHYRVCFSIFLSFLLVSDLADLCSRQARFVCLRLVSLLRGHAAACMCTLYACASSLQLVAWPKLGDILDSNERILPTAQHCHDFDVENFLPTLWDLRCLEVNRNRDM